MSSSLAVPHQATDVTRAWLQAALGRSVESCELEALPATWSTHVRVRAKLAGEHPPRELRVKIASVETFGRSEVDYYRRWFVDLADAPLVRCHAAGADATHYFLLLDDLQETHRNQFDVAPTSEYAVALADAAARLHAHHWPQSPPDATAIEQLLAPARAGMEPLLDAMGSSLGAGERRLVRDTVARLGPALRERLADARGFSWVHGDLNPGNILAPNDSPGPVLLIDHQPFADSPLGPWLAMSDLAHAAVVWWPVESRRALERTLVEHWHATLVARGVRDYPLDLARKDWRLCAAMGLLTPLERCSVADQVESMRWLWEAQLGRVLASLTGE